MGCKQLGFSDYELTTAKKQTKREKFQQRPMEWCNSGGPVTLSGG